MAPTVKLNSGYEMPLVGFGLWKVDNATCADTVYNAIKVGYRLFDGACGKSKSCCCVDDGKLDAGLRFCPAPAFQAILLRTWGSGTCISG